MVGEAGVQVGSQSDVEVRLGVGTLENVDETLVLRHATGGNGNADR